MAYFYSANYPEVLDNYQYYQHQYNNYYDSINHDYSRYVQYYDTEFIGNAYQHAPNPSLVGYYYSNYYQPEALTSKNAYFHENGDSFYCYSEPVSTEYITSYNVTNGEAEANSDIYFEEYNPEPFHGGYDIHETYGKPLPPSEKICYPNSKNDVDSKVPSLNVPSVDGSAPSPHVINDGKKVENVDAPKQSNGITPSKVIQDEEVEEDDDDDYDDDDDVDDYDDDDDYDYDDEEEEGGKQDDLGKEPVMAAPVASLQGDAINKKQDQNLGENSDDFDKKSSNGTKKVTIDEQLLHGKDHNQNVGEKNDDFDKKSSDGTKKVTSDDEQIHGKDRNQNVGEVIQGEEPSKLQNKEEEEEQQQQHLIDEGKKEGDNGSQMRRQIPPGYGMETLDLCEGIFGGYFPCLWKKYQRNYNQESGNNNYERMSDYDYCCKDTVDYLFGNPNPYGGMMPEKGSYGDPVYSYQRYSPQQTLTQHVDYYAGHSSGFQSSNYNYGNNGYYYHW